MTAVCPYCNQIMADVGTDSCEHELKVKFATGEELAAVPYEGRKGQRCLDCNVAPGGTHHPGCDMEVCPRCDEPFVGDCQCEIADDPNRKACPHVATEKI